MGNCYTPCSNDQYGNDIRNRKPNTLRKANTQKTSNFDITSIQTTPSASPQCNQLLDPHVKFGLLDQSSTLQSNKIQNDVFKQAHILSKLNKQFFVKDYSSYTLDQFLIDGNSLSPKESFRVLNEKKALLQQLKTTAEEKKFKIQRRLNILNNPSNKIVMIGNRTIKLDNPIQTKQYTKLVVEVKYAQFMTIIDKKIKPFVNISQPVCAIPNEFEQYFLGKQNPDVMILDRPSADLFASLINYQQIDKKHKRQNSDNNNFMKQLLGDKKSQKPQARNTIGGTGNVISKAHDIFSYNDGELKFKSSKANYIFPKDKKEKNKKKMSSFAISNLPSQIPVWQEAFILYYDHQTCIKSDRCFSIEMVYDKNGKTKHIGNKQTYMFEQFQNGQIYEQELKFGNEENNELFRQIQISPQNSVKAKPKKEEKIFQAKLYIKIQLYRNEVEKLQETDQILNEKIFQIEEALSIINQSLEEKENKSKRSSKASSKQSGNKLEQQNSSSLMLSKISTNVTPYQPEESAIKYMSPPKFQDYLEEIPESFIKEASNEGSQKAGFFQCQLMFIDPNALKNDKLAKTDIFSSKIERNKQSIYERYKTEVDEIDEVQSNLVRQSISAENELNSMQSYEYDSERKNSLQYEPIVQSETVEKCRDLLSQSSLQ